MSVRVIKRRKGHSTEAKLKMSVSRLRKKQLFGFLNSKETRLKMSLAAKARGTSNAKGKHWNLSEENKHNISLGHKGEKNYNWKDGISRTNSHLRKLSEYKEWRKWVFERDNFTCQICKKRGGKLNADHIRPFATFPELRLELSNGRTLCIPCHIKTDTYGWKALKLKQLDD